MARVVQRRTSPPYLLIVFVFLFLIATTLAVLGFIGKDEAQQANNDLQQRMGKLRDEQNELQEQLQQLVMEVTGKSQGTASEAIQASKSAYRQRDAIAEQIQSNYPDIGITLDTSKSGLASEVVTLAGAVEATLGQIANLNQEINEIKSKLDEASQQVASLQETHAERLDELNAQKKTLQEELKQEQTQREQAIQQASERQSAMMAEKEKQLRERQQRIEELLVELQTTRGRLRRVETELSSLQEQVRGGSAEVANQPDGRIEKLAADSDICYINIGSKDGVRQGMSFAVYSQDAQFKNDVKGSIRVTTVSENFSECKIHEENFDMPIVVGDAIANPAFAAAREYIFVIRGDFDLRGSGRPSDLGRKEVIEAIKRAGGNVAEEITVQTDYVVMGEEPMKPTAPSAAADPTVQKAYQEQLKAYNDYQQTVERASSMKIPVLNTNRFLLLTGYRPEDKQ